MVPDTSKKWRGFFFSKTEKLICATLPPLPWMRPGCQAHLFSNTMFANAQCELPLKALVQQFFQFPLKRVGCIYWGLLRNYPVAFKEWWRLFEFPHRARPRQAIFNLVLKIDNFHTKFGDSWEIRRPLRYVHTIFFICSGPFLFDLFPQSLFTCDHFHCPLWCSCKIMWVFENATLENGLISRQTLSQILQQLNLLRT